MQFSSIGLRSGICTRAHRSVIFDGDTGNESNIADGVVVFVDSQTIEFIDCEFIGNQDTPISIPKCNFTVLLHWGL